MTETQQKCFMAVAEHLSFSKAAELLYVSQPAISKNISALEAEVGMPLFSRQGKTVALTKAGEIFRDFIIEYDHSYRSTLERMSDLERDIHSGNIVIGCDPTWNASYFYPDLQRHFLENFPEMHLDLVGLEPYSFVQALRDKDADAVIMYAGDTKKIPDLVSVPLTTIGCGFLASAQLAESLPERPMPSDLEGLPFLVVDSATEKSGKLIYNTLFIDLYKNINPNPKLHHCRSLAAAQLAVSGGKGIMFADDWTGAISNPLFRYYPMDKSLELCIAYLASNAGTHIQFFAEEAAKVFGGQI